MMFQWFLRGVHDDGTLDDDWAKRVLDTEGLRSAWLRAHPGSDPADWDQAVNYVGSLVWHVNRFNDTGFPAWPHFRYGALSPFLSLSAGTVEPDHTRRRNTVYPAWYTALVFATRHGQGNGWIFHGYASTLGWPSLPLLESSEEIRDLHQHDFYNPYHPEGELAAKILVPPVRLKQAFKVTADGLREMIRGLENGADDATPADSLDLLSRLSTAVIKGDSFRAPEEFSNIRDLR